MTTVFASAAKRRTAWLGHTYIWCWLSRLIPWPSRLDTLFLILFPFIFHCFNFPRFLSFALKTFFFHVWTPPCCVNWTRYSWPTMRRDAARASGWAATSDWLRWSWICSASRGPMDGVISSSLDPASFSTKKKENSPSSVVLGMDGFMAGVGSSTCWNWLEPANIRRRRGEARK